MPVTLAFLNLGPTEIILVILLLIVLFGADKAPALARSLGRARAELGRAQREVTRAMKSEEEKMLDEQLKFERAREHQMAQQSAESMKLRSAAHALGLDTEGKSDDEVRAAIAAHVAADGQGGAGQGGVGTGSGSAAGRTEPPLGE